MIDIKKCIFSKDQIKDAKKYGINVELEHTNSRKKAYHIALQHECEFPLYYSKGLIPMEKRLTKQRSK